mgnify:CR=1 FL=1
MRYSVLSILERIHSPADLKALPAEEIPALCAELRSFLVENLAKTGGHLASNLGAVELTVAIDRVYSTEKDRLVFDVGHQSYVHKILTGRREAFSTLRQFGGIAGFPKPDESVHDAFVAGHASTSISVALGMARARTLTGADYDVIALIGDGALTGGLAYEGLSDAGQSGEPMVIVLNVPLFIVGLKKFGFAFLCKSIYTMTLSSILIDVVAAIHEFAPMDPLLACLYGGVTLGIASGLLFREETTTGGSELGAWIVRSHVERLSIGNICLGIDLTIILIYAAVFHSLNNALYGALALYITTKVLDLVVYGQNTAKVAYIISDKYEEIMQEMLRRDMGVTLLNGKGGYTGAERPLLFCAIRKKEAVSIKRYIKELDPDAFFIVCDASEVLGEGFGEYDPQGL